MIQMRYAPKDRPILLHFPKGWIQGRWHGTGWYPIRLDSHGCGCCAEENPEPDGWQELPQ